MKAIEDFLPRVLPFVPACPDITALQAVVDSAVEFCEQSLIIRHEPEPFQTVEGVSEYDIDIPSQHAFSRVIYVTVDGVELAPIPTEWQPTPTSSDSKPRLFFVSNNEEELLLNLYPVPNRDYTVRMSMALKPMRDSQQVPDVLYDNWADGVCYGALARLMLIPGQQYSSAAQSQFYKQRFAMICNQARNEGKLGRVVGSLQVRPRPFA
jgi:hypothetical protein